MDDLPDFMTENADGSITVRLRTGLTVDGAERKSIIMREPTVADTLAAKAAGGDDHVVFEITLIGNLSELSPETVKSMTMKDYTRLQAAVPFLHG